jgi:hypothetical protein
LNHLLHDPAKGWRFEPFDRVGAAAYHDSITKNLNGLDFARFQELVRRLPLRTRVMKLVPYAAKGRKRNVAETLYALGWKIPALREFLSNFILYVGENVRTRKGNERGCD